MVSSAAVHVKLLKAAGTLTSKLRLGNLAKGMWISSKVYTPSATMTITNAMFFHKLSRKVTATLCTSTQNIERTAAKMNIVVDSMQIVTLSFTNIFEGFDVAET